MRIPQNPPDWKALKDDKDGFAVLVRPDVQEFVQAANDKYLHWEKLRHQPLPEKVSALQAWAAVELSRISQRKPIPISFGKKGKLRFWLPPQHQEWVSTIDLQAGGFLGTQHRLVGPDDNERYLFNSLMEEAIASSRLEGASTTREVAKEMLRTERRPRNKAEQMIVNNYHAILDIRERKDDPLTPALLCHLQQVLTDKTMDQPAASGRFRRADELIYVVDNTTGEPLHVPPPAAVVEARVQEICDFANAKPVPFIHPVVRAMALHFAIGYVHPFVDGNGRTARAIFYWYLLKSGYWLFEYLPISRIIAAAPIKYGRAYLYVETDQGDLTYFNHYHLEVLIRAIDELHEYLANQQRHLSECEAILADYGELNHRQRSLIQNALKHPKHPNTIREHEGKFRVTYNTARSDLLQLVELGFLRRTKSLRRRESVFLPAADLIAKLRKDAKPMTQSHTPIDFDENDAE